MTIRTAAAAAIIALLLVAPIVYAAPPPAESLNARDFGAQGDGKAMDTAAIQKAIDSCSAQGGGRVIIPPGTFLVAPLRLRSHVELHLASGATLLGSPKLGDYVGDQPIPPPAKDKAAKRTKPYSHPKETLALILADDADDVSLTGFGTINGNGGSPDFDRGDNDSFRPRLLLFRNCRDVRVADLTLRDAATWVQYYLGCQRVRITGLRVYSHANLNNDGLDIDSTDVNVSDCVIDSDDDGICLKSNLKEPCENVTITNCVVGSNCNAIKMGTAGTGGFRNITILNCTIRAATEHRQRPWKDTISGLALELVDGGVMDRITASNLTMTDVQTPIFIRLGNRASRAQGATEDSGIGTLRNVTISNVTARSDTPICNSITGIPGHYAENIKLSHMIFDCPGGGTAAMTDITVPEKEKSYPENRMFGPSLPAYALYVRHARNVTFDDIQFNLLQPDERPAIVFDDVEGIRLRAIDLDAPTGSASTLQLTNVKEATIDGCRLRGDSKLFLTASGKATAGVRLTNNVLGPAATTQLAPDIAPSAVTSDRR